MKVNICGIPHTVIGCEDHFDVDTHFGQIDYKACEIRINKDLATEAMEETICHEMIHGILVHLGYSEQSQDETFVQALGNAIYQGFVVRVIEESEFDYEQQPCEDCISRQAVLDILCENKEYYQSESQYDRIEKLPSVTPKQKVSEWIDMKYKDEWWCPVGKCLNCGEEHILGSNYCPNCGAKMEVEDKDV